MLLELAIGDAYGAGFEYASQELIRSRNTGLFYTKHPRHAISPGCYTDDTQMSLAIAEALVSGEPWTPENLASRFVDVFRRDPREGYARGFHGFLREVVDGADFLARIRPESDKSGAAMRAGPIGVLPSIADVLDRSRIQADLTHATPDGRNAASAAALMSHYLLHRLGSKADLGEFLSAHLPGDWSIPWSGKVGPKGWMSVRAAITAVSRNDSMTALLIDCVNFTGDVDTVSSIALAAASCGVEYRQDLHENLSTTLENGQFGRDYLVGLDRRLLGLGRTGGP